MGEAKNRGSKDERKQAALFAGRMKLKRGTGFSQYASGMLSPKYRSTFYKRKRRA